MNEQKLTRFLVISDTHGEKLDRTPEDEVDVLIHCGDLTEESKIAEFRIALDYIGAFKAPLKLIIAGNHDFTLDDTMFRKKLIDIEGQVEPIVIKREYGDFGEARALLESEKAKSTGIVFLEEGLHSFKLANGTRLKVFASPFTPSVNEWGFQYDPQEEHDWPIPNDVDIVITHGPPRGVMDYTDARSRAGDADLFAATARARPKMHCFGHIHGGWGARKVTWRKEISENPSHFVDIDNEKSQVIENLSGVEPRKFDSLELIQQKALKLNRYKERGYCSASQPPQRGIETLFINAAIEGNDKASQNLPWIVILNLPCNANEEND